MHSLGTELISLTHFLMELQTRLLKIIHFTLTIAEYQNIQQVVIVTK